MRRLLATGMAALACSCDCGGYPSGSAADQPPVTPGCTTELPAPVAIHELAAPAGRIDLRFSACGHLFAALDGVEGLAAPDLARLEPLAPTPGTGDLRFGFAPTGELLARSRGAETRVLELGGGGETVLGAARDELFLPSHDGRRSILARCTDAGLTALDRGVERPVLADADCERYLPTARFAPLAVVTDREERLLVADLERGTVLDTGLPLAQREESTPEGEPGYRSDLGFLTWDGARLLHERLWQVFRGDTVEYVGTGELLLVETDGGRAAVYPSLGGELLGFFRTGFAWRSAWNRTHLAGAAGVKVVERRCDVSEVSLDGDRVLLSCYHESGPAYWQDSLVDTVDLSVRELGAAWSVRTLSGGGRAIAGCPTDAWRSGSCTVPTIRLWTERGGVQDLALDAPADVAWVGDDGATLALSPARDEATLRDPRGGVRARFPVSTPSGEPVRLLPTDEALVLHVRNGSLDVVVPGTGFHARLADVAIRAEPAAGRIAFTVPDGERFRLFAGGLPR